MPKPVSDPIVWRAFFPSFLRDAGFLEDLERTAPTDEAWGALAAGYRVLRLMDWVRTSNETLGLDGLNELQNSLQSSPQPLPRAAANLIETVAQSRGRRDHSGHVSFALFRYADELTTAFYHASARCVLSVVLESDDTPPEPSVSWRAIRLRGHLNQMEGHLDRAFEDFGACIAIGEASADLEAVLRGRANIGMLAAHRGDFPSAEAMMRRLVVDARASGIRSLMGRVAQNLGTILGMRGQFDEALEIQESSLQYVEGREHDSALADLAVTKMLAGDMKGARSLFQHVIREAVYPGAIWIARSNLIEIEAALGNRDAVDALVASLAHPLPQYEAQTKLSIGRAYKALGDTVKAAAWLGQALYDAERGARGNFVFDVEKELEELRQTGGAGTARESSDVKPAPSLDDPVAQTDAIRTNGSPE